jgi:hypothetical protein
MDNLEANDEFETILLSIPKDSYSEIMEKLKMLKTNEPSLLNRNVDGLVGLLNGFKEMIQGFNYDLAKKLVAASAVTFATTKHRRLEESSKLLDQYFDRIMLQFEPAFFNYKNGYEGSISFEKILVFPIFSEIKIWAFESVAFLNIGLHCLSQGTPEKAIGCLKVASAIADYIPTQIDEIEKEKAFLHFSGFKYHLRGVMSSIQAQIKLDSYDFSYFADATNKPEVFFEKALDSYMEGQSVISSEVFDADISKSIEDLIIVSLFSKLSHEIGKTMYLLLLSENKKIELSMHTLYAVYKKGAALALEASDGSYEGIFKILKFRLDNIGRFILNEKELIDRIRKQPVHIEEIKNLIAEDKVDFDRISELMPSLLLEIAYRDEFLILSGRYYRNKKARRSGMVELGECDKEHDLIVGALLEILGEAALDD